MVRTKPLFVIGTLEVGGSERQLVTLARALKDRGHEPSVAVLYGEGPLAGEVQEAEIPVHDLGKGSRLRTPIVAFRLARLAKRVRAELVHTYLPSSNLSGALAKPILGTRPLVWGIRAAYMDFSRYDFASGLANRAENTLSWVPERVIFNSHAGLRHREEQGFSTADAVVVPNGIDTDRFRPRPEARRRVRADWDIASDVHLVGHVGRLDPMKDHPTLLRSWARVAKEESSVRFVCVGGGPEGRRSELEQLAVHLGIGDRLLWAGHRPDISAVYNAIDLLVSSSYGEGFPNVVAEAMASGVPPVVTDVGDSARIVGNSAPVVPPRDPEALAHAQLEMVERLKQGREDASRYRERIIDRFDVSRLVARTEDVFEKTLATP